jgi:hypothetical protein
MSTSQAVEIPITKRARTYGYIIWRKRHTEEMSRLIGKCEVVDLAIGNTQQKGKRIDRKQRRISLGYRLTRSLSRDLKFFRIEMLKPGNLRISFR